MISDKKMEEIIKKEIEKNNEPNILHKRLFLSGYRNALFDLKIATPKNKK